MVKKDWYLVYSKPLKEQLALVNLERQGYKTYLPMMTTRKYIRGTRQTKVLPMFPRYLFVQLNTEIDNCAPIRSTLGVSHMVRFGALLAKVPQQFIQLLQEREQHANAPSVKDEFQTGEKIRVNEGPFAGYEGIFEKSKGSERAIILLNIANNYTKLSISTEQLIKEN